MTKICVISDTHEHEEATKKAVAIIKYKQPRLVLHLGDIISPPMLDNFEGLPMRFLFGNNDGEKTGLQRVCEKHGWNITDTFEKTIDDKKLFAAHGHRQDWKQAVEQQHYDIVFHGHTHIKKDEVNGTTRILNPGALWRAKEYTFFILDIANGEIEWFTVENE